MRGILYRLKRYMLALR